MRKSVVAASVAGAVVVGAGLGVGVSQILSSPQDVQSVATAASTAAVLPEASSLDDIVPGSGARGESSLLPGVGVDFPATCIGAAQAAASWQADLVNPYSPVYVNYAQNAPAAEESVLQVQQVLEDDVFGATPIQSNAVAGITNNLRSVAQMLEQKNETELQALYYQPKAFRLESCDEGSRAIVTVVSTTSTVENPARDEDLDWVELSTFVFDELQGSWQVSAVETSSCGFMSSSGKDLGELGQPFGSTRCLVDVDRIPGVVPVLQQLTGLEDGESLPSASSFSDELIAGLGRGTHYYAKDQR